MAAVREQFATASPDWLRERRKRPERALTTLVVICYLLRVSTRRLERLTHPLGITSLAKSELSELANRLDEVVGAFRGRPVDQGP